MQELRLVAVSEDGSYLVLATAGRGTRFTLPVDDRLRAAVRGHFSRLGQFEIEVESPLRPKEIQARIRAGETAEEIAESAGIPVERVRWFEGPVLQEREYMAQQAQRVTVRRQGETAPAPPLGEMVEERLGRRGVDMEEVEWDSWKCEDSTWRIRLSFFDEGRPNAAEWIFDQRRRQVSPLDEEAAALSSQTLDESVAAPVTQLVPRRPAMKIVTDARPGPPRAARRDDAAAGRITEPGRRPAVPSRWDPVSTSDDGIRYASFDEVYDQSSELADELGEPGPAQLDGGPLRPGEISVDDVPVRPFAAVPSPPPAAQIVPGRTEPEPPREEEAAPPVAPVRPAPVAESDLSAEPDVAEPDVAEPVAEVPSEPTPAAEVSEPVAAAPEVPEAAAVEQAPEAPAAEAETAPEAPAAEPAAVQEAPVPVAPAAVQKAAPVRARPEPVAAPAAEAPVEPEPAPEPKTVPEPAAAPVKEPARPAAQQPEKVAAAVAPDSAPNGPPQRNARRKTRGKRASVPSWDEIMFGARRPE